MLDILIAYAKDNIIVMILLAYYIVGVPLFIFFDIDILLPCLISLVTGHRCPGCGMTTAFMDILKLEFIEAFNSNPLIFIVLPALIYYVTTDFIKFKRNYEKQKSI